MRCIGSTRPFSPDDLGIRLTPASVVAYRRNEAENRGYLFLKSERTGLEELVLTVSRYVVTGFRHGNVHYMIARQAICIDQLLGEVIGCPGYVIPSRNSVRNVSPDFPPDNSATVPP